MNGKLNGKVALITGGTTGIGLATARLFADEGAQVIVTGSSEGGVAAARSELAGKAEVLRSDAGDPKQIAALFDHVAATHGGLDVLFLNAGIATFAPLAELSEEAFDAMFRVNVKGPWLALQRASKLLRRGGAVVVNTSIVTTKGFPATAAYAGTKAALRSIARVAAAELAPHGIRVNAVSPGPIDTPIYGKLGLPKAGADELMAGMAQTVALKRLGRPEEVARAALFLASSDASFVVGVELTVDGGLAEL